MSAVLDLGQWRAARVRRECRGCGEPFTPHHPKAVRCLACRDQLRELNGEEPGPPPVLACIACGTRFDRFMETRRKVCAGCRGAADYLEVSHRVYANLRPLLRPEVVRDLEAGRAP